ncbi:ABC-F family ATP-binding cassette domain-containing protein [Simkania negevensis]|uniref:ABC-F family ATP-binding cassette domain-containing protein n=1 Tax=Simkania negevensis TaxID=83561 RepID=A0ABS3AUY9_9BACT|nr:ABC-F family ATP-binding cassette domain-containing protein [Simkania negevensis]
MITLDNLSKRYGTKVMFDDATLSFNEENRYGLTGPNGCGKSTLLRIIMKEEEPTSGCVTTPKRISMLKQNIEDYLDNRVVDVVIMGNEKLWKALEERDKLYDEEMTEEIGMRLGELEEVIADEEGYTAESDAEEFLAGMCLDESMFERKMKEIPTDMQFRVLLCQALFGTPQALLLDEPTNHLDMDSIGWLEEFLKEYTGVLIVTSHDRHFLNTITTHIADIDYETIIVYPGNYDRMVTTKTAVRGRAQADVKSKEKKISQLKEFVSKFSAGSRASQVQSRIKEIDRLQPQELKKSNIQRPYINFPTPQNPSGKLVYKIENLYKQYEEGHDVIKGFTLDIYKGDKIGVIGNNGRGKTTFLKMLAQALEPSSGVAEVGHNVRVSYFPQNHSDVIESGVDATLFDWLREKKEGVYDQDIRGVLGKLLFGGDDAFKQVTNLSGGETARLILAGMMLQDNNTLVLDEPNNHLDLEAVSALGWALENYQGAAIVASHDRDLLSSFATKIIAFEADGIHIHQGGLDEYLEKRKKAHATTT